MHDLSAAESLLDEGTFEEERPVNGATGAEILLRSLQAEGVEVLFGYPGGSVLPIYDALYSSGLRHIRCRHEQGAAHAADGYARATGKVGVCLATSGPGATNLVTGIATAFMDSVPMVAITGQVPTSLIGKDSFQEVDIVGVTLPITKHSYSLRDARDIPKVVREAFFVARTGRPGPVLIDVPKDVAVQTADFGPPKETKPRGYMPRFEGDPSAVSEAAGILVESERPVIFAGGGVVSSDTARLLKELCQLLQAPVALSMMGLGAVEFDYPLLLGMLGMHGSYAANTAVTQCDVLAGIGVRFDDRVTGNVRKFAPRAKIIHMDIDPAEMNKNVKAAVSISADLRWSLRALVSEIRERTKKRPRTAARKEWVEKALEWKSRDPLAYRRDNGGSLSPRRVIKEIWKATEGNAIVVTDVGQHQMWTAQAFGVRRPRSFISSGGLGTMGFGLPAGIGAKIGRPKDPVWVISGDGGFLMNCQELAALRESGIDLKIAVLNNRCLGMVRQWQEFFFERRYSQSLFRESSEVSCAAIAGAFGIWSRRIDSPRGVSQGIEEAASHDQAAVLEFMIEEEANVLPMVPAGGALDEMLGLV